MKRLRSIVPPGLKYEHSADPEIFGITMDSRQAGPNCNLFVAIRGTQTDGHLFIEKAIANGSNVILCEKRPDLTENGVIYLEVENPSVVMGQMASAFYDDPSTKLRVIGVTGTNGKTTVTTLLHQLFTLLGERCGLLSTVSYHIADKVYPSTHTTPDSIRLHAMLAEMVEAGCSYCFMEISSHAIDQNRHAGLHLEGAVFTNISHDHLDYHGTFRNYLYTKKRLFDELPLEAFALVNRDDKNASVMVQNCKAPVYGFALKRMADFRARILEHDFSGMQLRLNDKDAWFKLVGAFNAYNLLAVFGTAFLCGKEEDDIITAMTQLVSVQGRFEYLRNSDNVTAIVDYAHTPDALENVLQTINGIRSKNEELICVVGCGGDRDKEKRPIMAEVAARLSDRVILTTDNPRFEEPDSILKEMEQGVPVQYSRKAITINDRENAIKTAIALARPGDIILIAGKGHETYQEIKGIRHPFDDRQVFIKYSNPRK
ncbi:MAG: UDP-N-acetylmuramoyl-L-alanyl-D-glutamate--2,6-diaminopimelate ligase [Flavobacteriales bacterium]|nr:UDP-N-acetylmuramoyl-L-alanyl-D-glutamate--2,6-diaminopimelate ligase [Flavobacteriales bacterium]